MKKLIVLIFCLVGVVSAQKDSDVLLEIGDRQVTKAEFEYFFKKNKKDDKVTREELDEYLTLYKKFILKVYEAEQMQRDTLTRFVSEYEYYKNQLAKPYLTSTEVTDELVNEALARRKQEVRASHILIKVGPNDTPEDTLKAYNRMLEVQKELNKGMSFEAAAKKYSEGSTKDRGGDLGYFSVLNMVYAFENQAYNTPVGQESGIFRTRFGYHILKVTDKRKARGEVKVAHIMVLNQGEATVEGAPRKKIEEIYQRIQEGEDFARLALLYSDDSKTNSKGGELEWFSSGKMVAEFEEAAFDLKNNGDVSKPFKTAYGWHIVKRLDYRSLEEDEVVRKDIEMKIKKDIARTELSKSVFYNGLKKEYNFKKSTKALGAIIAKMDSSIYTGSWQCEGKDKMTKNLFSFADKSYTQKDFITYVEGLKINRLEGAYSVILNNWLEDYVRRELLAYESEMLSSKYPKYRYLLQEYHDGMLLFDLVQEMVWKKAESDTNGLTAFYEANIGGYQWNDRVYVTSYKFEKEEKAKEALKMLQKGKSDSALLAHFNQQSQLVLILEEKVFEKGKDASFEMVNRGQPLNGPFQMKEQFYVFKTTDYKDAQAKNMEECRGLLISNYQTVLENQWIEALAKKYGIKVNEQVLYSLINE